MGQILGITSKYIVITPQALELVQFILYKNYFYSLILSAYKNIFYKIVVTENIVTQIKLGMLFLTMTCL